MSSKHKNLVRELVKHSANSDGLILQNLVEEVLSGLRELNPHRHLIILTEYLAEIRKLLRNQIVEVELGCESSEELVHAIKQKIGSVSSKSLDLNVSRNDQLAAGYRIRIVDDVYEDSISSRLSKLSQSLTL